ncbi:MAG TPA: hypothetical protein VIW07_02070, partial [Candidatus Udaeobacter sp.]
AFRALLVVYFLFEVVVSLYHAFFGTRVPTSIVHPLYMVFGEPVPIPQPLALTFGVIGATSKILNAPCDICGHPPNETKISHPALCEFVCVLIESLQQSAGLASSPD